MTQAIKAVTTTCWQHVRMPPGPRCASAVGKWRKWWRGSLGAMSAPAYAPTCASYHSSSDSPCLRDRDNKPLLFLMKRTQKPQKKKKKVESRWSPWQLCCIFDTAVFWCAVRIEKGKRYCRQPPFPVPEYRGTYFHTVSAVLWKWSLGSEVLFPQTIVDSV